MPHQGSSALSSSQAESHVQSCLLLPSHRATTSQRGAVIKPTQKNTTALQRADGALGSPPISARLHVGGAQKRQKKRCRKKVGTERTEIHTQHQHHARMHSSSVRGGLPKHCCGPEPQPTEPQNHRTTSQRTTAHRTTALQLSAAAARPAGAEADLLLGLWEPQHCTSVTTNFGQVQS